MVKDFYKFISPIIYFIVWVSVLIIAKNYGLQISELFLILSLIILLFSRMVSKSTSWLIGHEKFGIRGDSTSKKIEFCADGIGTIKIYNDNLDEMERLMEKAEEVINKIKKINNL